MSNWTEITLEAPAGSAEAAAAVLTESGCSGAVIHDPQALSADPFAEAPGAGLRAGGPCRICAYRPADDRLGPVLEEIRRRLRLLAEHGIQVAAEIRLRTVAESSWSEAWKAHFRPFRIGPSLVVCPPWEAWDARPGDVVLELDPGMAFGTGAHPSTRLTLLLLQERLAPGDRVLDWGTGSGILAAAAWRLGAAELLAVDLDAGAVRIARANLARNGFAHPDGVREASIEQVAGTPPYDLVLANILADPLVEHAAEIRRCLRPGGAALLSGFTADRVGEVSEGMARVGLGVRREVEEEEWRALVVSHD